MQRKALGIEVKLKDFFDECEINKVAHETKFRRRNDGKITPLLFLCLSCQKALNGGCSIRNFAVTLSKTINESVSKQAIWKKISPMTTLFLVTILQRLIARKANTCKIITKELLKCFPRILIQDSSLFPLNKGMFNDYPGSANQNGPTSSVKVQAVYNLINSTFAYFKLASFRDNDQRAAHDLSFLQKGDLLIRDLGYFSVKVFKQIDEDYKAFFLSRLKFGTGVLDPETNEPIKLLKLLKGKETIDINILLGNSAKLSVRLVGEKVPEDIANKRRRELKNNRNRTHNPSDEHLEQAGWSLYVTNIPKDVWDLNTILLIYSLRWRIEIIFKSWKSSIDFNINYKMSKQQLELLIYSRLIIITLFTTDYYFHFEAKVYEQSKRHLSLLKFLDIFMKDSEMVELLIQYETRGKKLLLMKILIKHATYEKRRRLSYSDWLYQLDSRIGRKAQYV